MPRIDPAAVLAACRQFPNFKVVQKRFGDRDRCGCALTVMALSLGMSPHYEGAVLDFLEGRGYVKPYQWGFTIGFDDMGVRDDWTWIERDGYADGTATRELLVREGVMA